MRHAKPVTIGELERMLGLKSEDSKTTTRVGLTPPCSSSILPSQFLTRVVVKIVS